MPLQTAYEHLQNLDSKVKALHLPYSSLMRHFTFTLLTHELFCLTSEYCVSHLAPSVLYLIT